MSTEPSIFTKIYNGDIPSEIVYKDDLVFAIKDINPQAPVHILIIPIEPVAYIHELDDDKAAIAGRLLVAAGKIAKEQGLDQTGYRLVNNNGDNGGQEVHHLHIHLLGGRKMTWPPG